MKLYQVGIALHSGNPAVIHDGDSVFLEVDKETTGAKERVEFLCALLNEQDKANEDST